MIDVIRENNRENIIGRHLAVKEKGFARTSSHPLNKTLKKLAAEAEDAVEKLVHIMNKSEDEKLVRQAAKDILDLQRQFALDINQDEMQRLIANVKYGGPRQLEADDTPTISMDIHLED